MGRRRQKAHFAPGKYVFPGGIFERDDIKINASASFRQENLSTASSHNIQGLANTAIRECYEETGLLLAERGTISPTRHPTWESIRRKGLTPLPNRLIYLGRAITPPSWPKRFHARFFVAPFEIFEGTLIDEGELIDLRWLDIEAALRLPILDVTEFMIGELRRFLHAPRVGTPIMSYRKHHTLVRYEQSHL